VPIWKKEVYEGEAAEWKENKESAAPTIGQMQARGAASKRYAALSLVVAVAAAALAFSLRGKR
jgi:hypothetical protein